MADVVVASAYGGPEVLRLVDEPVTDPGPGQARIAVRAAGVNPVDYKAYSGAFGTDPARLPIRLGSEAAGVVTAAGTDEAMNVSLALVADRARIATIAAFARGLQEGTKVLGGAPGADPGTQIRDAARLELARLAQDGTLRVHVDQTFPLADVAAAHRAIMRGHILGKIALIP